MMQGVLRVHSQDYGGCWLPVFVASQQRKNSEVYWPVSLNLTQLTCIVCTAARPIPQVRPRAITTLIGCASLRAPGVTVDMPAMQAKNCAIVFWYTRLHKVCPIT